MPPSEEELQKLRDLQSKEREAWLKLVAEVPCGHIEHKNAIITVSAYYRQCICCNHMYPMDATAAGKTAFKTRLYKPTVVGTPAVLKKKKKMDSMGYESVQVILNDEDE